MAIYFLISVAARVEHQWKQQDKKERERKQDKRKEGEETKHGRHVAICKRINKCGKMTRRGLTEILL